jgi:hypothetical protein
VLWKTMDYERVLRRPREAPDAPNEPQ